MLDKIVETITFFDLFDYPLTAHQIWKYLRSVAEYQEVVNILESSDGKRLIGEKRGFYFLAGRSAIVETRIERYKITDQKMKKLKKTIFLLELVPWVRFIGLANQIGEHNMRREGDIDLFVITATDRIWLARFFSVLLLKALNLRPRPGRTQDKICLSFFMAEDSLDLARFFLPGSSDVYFEHWLCGLVPVFDRKDYYEQLLASNRSTVSKFPQFVPNVAPHRYHFASLAKRHAIKSDSRLASKLESWVKILQMRLLPDEVKNLMNKTTNVVLDDQALKLHTNDRRIEYRRLWEDKVKTYYE